MGRRGFCWNFYSLKDEIINHFYRNKKQIIVLSFCFFVGILTGILTLSQLTKVFSASDVSDILLIDTINGGISFMAFFFRRFFSILFAFALVFLACLNYFTSFLTYFYILYRGYLVGLNLAIFIFLYGIGGVVNIVIFYFPFQLVFNFILINFSAIWLNTAKEKRKFKNLCIHQNIWLVFLIFFVLIFLMCFIEAIFLPHLLKNIILSV